MAFDQSSMPPQEGAGSEQFPFPSANNGYGQTMAPSYPAGQFPALGTDFNTPSPAPVSQIGQPISQQGPFPRPPQRKSSASRSVGFTLASLFLVTGALILLVVYFMAQSLPGTMTTSTTSPVSTAKVASAPTPHVANTPTTTKTPAATATTTYPGQQYIDSAQMATAIDPATAQPAQTSKTFAVNQRIYVAFAVHSGGAAGAACLVWYLHNAPIINYTMSVGATTHAYSYAAIGSTGPAYVEIYWASTTACTDKVLAQHVDFTVGA